MRAAAWSESTANCLRHRGATAPCCDTPAAARCHCQSFVLAARPCDRLLRAANAPTIHPLARIPAIEPHRARLGRAVCVCRHLCGDAARGVHPGIADCDGGGIFLRLSARMGGAHWRPPPSLCAQGARWENDPAVLLTPAQGRAFSSPALPRPLLEQPQHQRHARPPASQSRPEQRPHLGSA